MTDKPTINEALVVKFWQRVAKAEGCWEWRGSKNGRGYGQFHIGGGKYVSATQLSVWLHTGRWPMGGRTEFVCHHCDNPGCVRPDHLFLGSPADNAADRDRKGRTAPIKRGQPRGEQHGSAKLTARAIAEIRKASGPQWQIASAFGITQSQVSRIRSGQNWAHVSEEFA